MTNPTLRELVGLPVEITVDGHQVAITPMSWYQGGEALEYILPVLQAMPAIGGELGDSKADRVALWSGVIVTFRDEIAKFCAAASGMAIDEIKALPPAAAIDFVMGVIEVNADFFERSLPGLLKGAQGRLARLMERWAPIIAAGAAASDSTTSSSG